MSARPCDVEGCPHSLSGLSRSTMCVAHEPLTCTCGESGPNPDHLGECPRCHRLVPTAEQRRTLAQEALKSTMERLAASPRHGTPPEGVEDAHGETSGPRSRDGA